MTGKRGWSALLIVAGLLLFTWPALVNRGPFLHPDTSNYIRAADGAVVALTGHRSVWSDRLVAAQAASAPAPVPGTKGEAGGGWSGLRPTRTVLSGRSIYYGMTLFLLLELIGKWGPVLFQAGVALATVLVTTRVATRDTGHRGAIAWVVVAVLGIATPLPFYAAMLMPDLFAGLLALALATLVVFWERLTVPARIFLGCVAAGSIVFHTSHVLLTILIGGAMLVVHLARWRRFARPALAVVPGMVVLAVAAQFAYGAAVRHAIGIAPISPPFLSARMIDHGPGLTLLRETCPASGYALCDHLAILPVDSDDFLWAKTPDKGVFSAAAPEEKRRLAAEDRGFFLDVVRAHPLDTLNASLDAMRRQVTMLGYKNFNLVEVQRASLHDALPAWAEAWETNTRAFQHTMPTWLPGTLATLSTLLALIGLGAAVLARRTPAPVLVLAGLMVATVLFNAAICGALSKPHERYQMRIVWLLPLAALLALPPVLVRRGGRADRRVPA